MFETGDREVSPRAFALGDLQPRFARAAGVVHARSLSDRKRTDWRDENPGDRLGGAAWPCSYCQRPAVRGGNPGHSRPVRPGRPFRRGQRGCRDRARRRRECRCLCRRRSRRERGRTRPRGQRRSGRGDGGRSSENGRAAGAGIDRLRFRWRQSAGLAARRCAASDLGIWPVESGGRGCRRRRCDHRTHRLGPRGGRGELRHHHAAPHARARRSAGRLRPDRGTHMDRQSRAGNLGSGRARSPRYVALERCRGRKLVRLCEGGRGGGAGSRPARPGGRRHPDTDERVSHPGGSARLFAARFERNSPRAGSARGALARKSSPTSSGHWSTPPDRPVFLAMRHARFAVGTPLPGIRSGSIDFHPRASGGREDPASRFAVGRRGHHRDKAAGCDPCLGDRFSECLCAARQSGQFRHQFR